MPKILLLGSTGSIGTQTLDLVRASGGQVQVEGLAAGSSWELLLEQVRLHEPRWVAMASEEAARQLAPHLPQGVRLLAGPEALVQLVAEADYDLCVHGVVGSAGLPASVGVLERGKTLALANKESLVVAGDLLMALAEEHGAEIIPVDSEHSAVFQCLRGEDLGRVRRVLLTASGGPFRELPAEEFASITPERALEHPNWDMGPRITVGSATLMNKALEVIELHHLFSLERDRIEVVVHPQSIVHSMVEFVDGSVIAQMGPPDMRGPIQYALNHPDRGAANLTGFDLSLFQKLTFEAVDLVRFPSLALGFRCVEEGGDAGCVLNASDEVAVESFLGGGLDFAGIHATNEAVLGSRHERGGSSDSIEALLEADVWARNHARERIAAAGSPGASDERTATRGAR